jgi:hypothetical protein
MERQWQEPFGGGPLRLCNAQRNSRIEVKDSIEAGCGELDN